jgi:hypothetical protein
MIALIHAADPETNISSIGHMPSPEIRLVGCEVVSV